MDSHRTGLSIEHLTFCYAGQEKSVLQDITLQIPKGSFFMLCGTSGSGKSTLLRTLHPAMAPNGKLHGAITWNGKSIQQMTLQEQTTQIGFVQQNPDYQIVTDKVWHELAFGLESLGYETSVIRRRVAEMASFFGIQQWFHNSIQELSGGQKQILNLASVMVLQPEILLLDEPTSQLDPIASKEFLELLAQINRELGTTIVLIEHRLEEAMALADHMAVLEEGTVIYAGTPAHAGHALYTCHATMYQAMPCAVQVWTALHDASLDLQDTVAPVTVLQGRNWLSQYAETHTLIKNASIKRAVLQERSNPEIVLSAEEVWFRYEKNSADIVKGVTLHIQKGTFVSILGGNGTGKTTMLKVLSGLYRPYRGMVTHTGNIALLPQNPQTLFVKKTVLEDLLEALDITSTITSTHSLAMEEVERMAMQCHIMHLLHQHPYDLSGGEQQRVAMAKILLRKPDILLLDEPTKGCDIAVQQSLANGLLRLQRNGMTIVMVSHDLEFCARYAERCMLFFDGTVIAEGEPRSFFSGNHFYTTAANRMARHIIADAILPEDIINAYTTEQNKILQDDTTTSLNFSIYETKNENAKERDEKKESKENNKSKENKKNNITQKKHRKTIRKNKTEKNTHQTTAITIITGLIILCTLLAGLYLKSTRHYYFIALLVLLESMVPIIFLFENRKPLAREIVIVSVLCAIAIAGRALFFMLPQVKPVLAVVILSGAALGSEVGIFVGAITMLVSNLLFAQGPWTPWQMFAMGLIGGLSGILFRNPVVRQKRLLLCLFGLFSAILLYGVIMNLSTAFLYQTEWNTQILLTYLISGFPMDCIHGFATALFLWIGANPILEKLERLKIKYGCFTNVQKL